MATATNRIEKRSGDAGAGRARAKAAKKAAAGPTMAECRRMAARLKMLADGSRIGILMAIADGERNVTQLTELLPMTQPGVSHHLALLKLSGVVAPHRAGKFVRYGLTDDGRALVAVVRAMLA